MGDPLSMWNQVVHRDRAGGIQGATLQNWRKKDPRFSQACGAARAECLTQHVANINQAARKDWKASAYVLERSSETRDDYQQAQTEKPHINITLNIDRQGIEWVDGRPVIDVETSGP